MRITIRTRKERPLGGTGEPPAEANLDLVVRGGLTEEEWLGVFDGRNPVDIRIPGERATDGTLVGEVWVGQVIHTGKAGDRGGAR